MASDPLGGAPWRVARGDCVEGMAALPAACVDLAVTSPPFPQLYAYTSEPGDVGNSEGLESDCKLHLGFFYAQLARVVKPGRAAVVHVMQVPRMKRAGGQGLFDFRGLNVRLGERAGLVYCYDWLVRKNPQAQAITTRSRELQFAGLESDRARSRGCLGDYLIKFVAPGDNAVPVDAEGQVSRNDWIAWAEACWDDVDPSDTLNFRAARAPDDLRHICPLQLEVYRRLVLLFTNPGEVVLDPFAGIGSAGHVARGGASPRTRRRVREPRRFLGFELKPEYHAAALDNVGRAERQHKESQRTLFDGPARESAPAGEEAP